MAFSKKFSSLKYETTYPLSLPVEMAAWNDLEFDRDGALCKTVNDMKFWMEDVEGRVLRLHRQYFLKLGVALECQRILFGANGFSFARVHFHKCTAWQVVDFFHKGFCW